MPSDQQVRRWLDSFQGPIADAGYADSMIEAGYDCLANMVFSADDLMASILEMKQGHANRIARDAAAMLENMGDVIAISLRMMDCINLIKIRLIIEIFLTD